MAKTENFECSRQSSLNVDFLAENTNVYYTVSYDIMWICVIRMFLVLHVTSYSAGPSLSTNLCAVHVRITSLYSSCCLIRITLYLHVFALPAQ